MARPGGTYGTFEAGSFGYSNSASAIINHEDLVDVVTILDSLAATAVTGAIEGNDFAGSTLTGPVRLFNVTQIFRRDVVVADRERDANPAGIRDMYEHQIM